MYYSEKLRSALTTEQVKQTFGIDPTKNFNRALHAGIFHLEEVPAGYEVSHYVRKSTSTYTAVPKQLTTSQINSVDKISTLEAVVKALVSDWSSDGTYTTGSLVEHNSVFYTSTSSTPSEEPGTGSEWSVVS